MASTSLLHVLHLPFLLLALLVALGNGAAADSSHACSSSVSSFVPCPTTTSSSPPNSIHYYVHALNGQSANVVELPSTAASTFGLNTVFAYNITKEQDINSQQLGTIRGLEVYNSFDPAIVTILLLNTVTYDDGVSKGTVSLHGQANTSDTAYELSVVGGTGDFRGVRGYAAITNLHAPGSDHIFLHQIQFLQDATHTYAV